MNQREATRLVWAWVTVAMDQCEMSWDLSDAMMAQSAEDTSPEDQARLRAAWGKVRAEAARRGDVG